MALTAWPGHARKPRLHAERAAPRATPQALTDSVLLKISHTGRNFRGYTVHGDGSTITVEPGLIGGEVGWGGELVC